MQCKWTFIKRFTLSSPQSKFPTKHVLHSHPFRNRIQVELYTNFPNACTFCHPLQLLLNWGIIQYRYYCELLTLQFESDLKYSQLLLWCFH